MITHLFKNHFRNPTFFLLYKDFSISLFSFKNHITHHIQSHNLIRRIYNNHSSGNIQQVRYGDISDYQYTQDSYNRYQSETDRHILNIGYANAYIYLNYGTYDIYKTIPDLHTNIYAANTTQFHYHPYRNKPITIHVNLMYGLKALSILSLRRTGKVKGFCNKDGQGSPVNHLSTKDSDADKNIFDILAENMAII